MSPAELADFERSLSRVIAILHRFGRSLTPRELTILRLGLRASHVEEAIVQGDTARAHAHLSRLVQDARALGPTAPPTVGALPHGALLPLLVLIPIVPPL